MRRLELDLCRIVACIMVIFLHVAGSNWYISPTTTEWGIYNFMSLLVRGAVPVFFMISGTLFLSREQFDIRHFIKKNVCHLIFLYGCWLVLYAFYTQWMENTLGDWHMFVKKVEEGYGHLWFMPAMILCYLALPVIWSAVHGEKLNVKYLLFLFLIVTIFQANVFLFSEWLDKISRIVGKFDVSYLQYLGYMILGYYLSRRDYGRKGRWIAVSVYTVSVAVATGVNYWYSISHGKAVTWIHGHYIVLTVLESVAIYCFMLSFAGNLERIQRPLKFFSDQTLGIYLVHAMILDYLIHNQWKVSMCTPWLSIPLLTGMVFIISIVLVFIGRKIPVLHRLLE